MIYGVPNRAQFEPFAAAIGLGFVCGMLWDVLRVCRKLREPSKVRLFVEDVLFFLVWALLTFALCFAFNFGKVRAYILFAQVIGFFVWYCLPGRFADRAADGVQKALRMFVLRPWLFFSRVICLLQQRMSRKHNEKRKKQRKKQKKTKKIISKQQKRLANKKNI